MERSATEASPSSLVLRYIHAMRTRGFSTKSIRVYDNDLALFSRWYAARAGAPFDPTKVTATVLTTYRDELQREGKSPATVNRRVQVMRSFCRWAHAQGLLEQDPGRTVGSVKVDARTTPRGLARNDVNALLRAAQTSPRGQAHRNHAILQVLLQTGIRAGELVRLKAGDVKLGEREALLRVRNEEGSVLREIPLNGSARVALRAYLAERKADPEGPLFLSERGGGFSIGGVEMLMHSLAARAGVKRRGINVSLWRHHFALTWLKDHPGDLEGLQHLLGHRRLSTTAIYVPRSAPSNVAAKMERLSSNVYANKQ